jgi:hypothetical protein
MTEPYKTGADMWYDYAVSYGEEEAIGICNRYLDLQIFNKNPEEQQFCRELYAAMPEIAKPSILNDLSEKKKAIQDNPNDNTVRKKRETQDL